MEEALAGMRRRAQGIRLAATTGRLCIAAVMLPQALQLLNTLLDEGTSASTFNAGPVEHLPPVVPVLAGVAAVACVLRVRSWEVYMASVLWLRAFLTMLVAGPDIKAGTFRDEAVVAELLSCAAVPLHLSLVLLAPVAHDVAWPHEPYADSTDGWGTVPATSQGRSRSRRHGTSGRGSQHHSSGAGASHVLQQSSTRTRKRSSGSVKGMRSRTRSKASGGETRTVDSKGWPVAQRPSDSGDGSSVGVGDVVMLDSSDGVSHGAVRHAFQVSVVALHFFLSLEILAPMLLRSTAWYAAVVQVVLLFCVAVAGAGLGGICFGHGLSAFLVLLSCVTLLLVKWDVPHLESAVSIIFAFGVHLSLSARAYEQAVKPVSSSVARKRATSRKRKGHLRATSFASGKYVTKKWRRTFVYQPFEELAVCPTPYVMVGGSVDSFQCGEMLFITTLPIQNAMPWRYRRDTCTAAAFALLDNVEGAVELIEDTTTMTSDEFSLDAALCMYVLANPSRALGHRVLLEGIALVFEYWKSSNRTCMLVAFGIREAMREEAEMAPDDVDRLYRIFLERIDGWLDGSQLQTYWTNGERLYDTCMSAIDDNRITIIEVHDCDLVIVQLQDPYSLVSTELNQSGSDYDDMMLMLLSPPFQTAIHSSTSCYNVLLVAEEIGFYYLHQRLESYVMYQSDTPHLRRGLSPLAWALTYYERQKESESEWTFDSWFPKTTYLMPNAPSSLSGQSVVDVVLDFYYCIAIPNPETHGPSATEQSGSETEDDFDLASVSSPVCSPKAVRAWRPNFAPLRRHQRQVVVNI